jgi:pimeloyl-ACP methyl ester carboxylesterase
VIESGKEEPRLIHFTQCLVNCGFSVLIPEFTQMKSLTLVMEESRDIVDAFRFMLDRAGVDKERVGLIGFSFGAGPTLSAAADPAIRDQVKFVVVFGGYFDPVNVIRYVTTGSDSYRGHTHTQEPNRYGKEVFVRNIVRHAADANDRVVLERLFEQLMWQHQAHDSGLGELSRGGRALYDLIANKDGAAVEGLIARTDDTVKAYLNSLSLGDRILDIKARVFIGHGNTDGLMPSTESLRLAAALPPQNLGYVAILEIIGHVDPDQSRSSVREFLTASLPALLRFHGLVRRILDQQR